MGTDVVGVSNYHVIAIDVSGTISAIGEPIMQPSPGDLWSCIDYESNDVVGVLADYEPIQFCDCQDSACLDLPANINTVDAAVFGPASFVPDLAVTIDNATLPDGYGMPKSDTISPAELTIGMNVQKYGRTTGQTNGFVSAIGATFNVQYPNGLCARFVDQVVIESAGFSAAGDSGSLIVVDDGCNDRRPVGLLFAGDQATITVANPIDEVLNAFPGLTVDGE
ncbi:MAG: hypothetical protein GWM89_08020 [Candidatus Dadabacteria bacterium]|nr:hypothetical protein [Candidatus Dadabacteria bacterium]NIY22357.1 hypothetical protein [Candidatus Dadabacteria bacterium]